MSAITVKLCGLQTVEAVASLQGKAVDHIGFVFARSKRQISTSTALELIRHIERNEEGRPLTVGVFVNPTKEELARLVADVPLDVIQLHGTESVALCQWVRRELGKQVFKVMAIDSSLTQNGTADDKASQEVAVRQQCDPYAGHIDALLLDTYDPVYGGGSGEVFAWDCIPIYQKWTKQHHIPLIIAGGLHEGNVAELIQTYAPDGVDVSSGIETNGVKDTAKMAQFINEVKKS